VLESTHEILQWFELKMKLFNFVFDYVPGDLSTFLSSVGAVCWKSLKKLMLLIR
jgi:hypothetical protein